MGRKTPSLYITSRWFLIMYRFQCIGCERYWCKPTKSLEFAWVVLCKGRFSKSVTMVNTEVYVPKMNPKKPTAIIAKFFTKASGWSPSRQKVSVWKSGGKMTARPELATAPISAMKSSRSGMPAASAAVIKKHNTQIH